MFKYADRFNDSRTVTKKKKGNSLNPPPSPYFPGIPDASSILFEPTIRMHFGEFSVYLRGRPKLRPRIDELKRGVSLRQTAQPACFSPEQSALLPSRQAALGTVSIYSRGDA